MLIENNYNDGTFFVANIKFSEERAKIRKVLRAVDMATTLTDYNLPEHFCVDKNFISNIQIVQAYSQIENQELKQSSFGKSVITISKENFVKQPLADFVPIIIVQAIGFDRLLTDAFYTASVTDATTAFKNYGCRTAYNFNVILTRIIKNITF